VKINGVVWATRNVDKPGRFVDTPDLVGTALDATLMHKACPEGWRPPTTSEFQSLVTAGYEWKSHGGVDGSEFGYGDSKIFLPVTLRQVDAAKTPETGGDALGGWYWTSSQEKDGVAQRLHFSSRGIDPSYRAEEFGSQHRNSQFGVRCVKAGDIIN
jgi:uncharacterized protein (TIGR02145 family)